MLSNGEEGGGKSRIFILDMLNETCLLATSEDVKWAEG